MSKSLFLLLPFSFLAAGFGEEALPPAAPSLSAAVAADEASPAPAAAAAEAAPDRELPAALGLFRSVLLREVAPERYMSYTMDEEGKLSAEDLEECAQARERVDAAIEAAVALYRARLNLVSASLRASYVADDDERLESALDACGEILAECFLCDLRAYVVDSSWLFNAELPPPARPGRQLRRIMPACAEAQSMNTPGGTYECDLLNSRVNSVWEGMQEAFLAEFRLNYEPESGMRDTFSGQIWEGIVGQSEEDAQRKMAMMRDLLDKADEAWKNYREAMMELTSPSRSYRGTGSGGMWLCCERGLLQSRERFLCMLALGVDRLEAIDDLDAFRRAELTELHPDHPFGEIFSCEARLFCHPGLKGRPWCISFHRLDPGYILVRESPALLAFARQHPTGGVVEVKGYQCIDCVGTPYTEAEDAEVAGRPGGGLEPRQVFVLLECTTEADRETEAEAEAE